MPDLEGTPVTGDALHAQVGQTQTGRGHGRIEKRTVKVVTAEGGRRSRPITPGTGKRAKWS